MVQWPPWLSSDICPVSSVVEHSVYIRAVGGSNPSRGTNLRNFMMGKKILGDCAVQAVINSYKERGLEVPKVLHISCRCKRCSSYYL